MSDKKLSLNRRNVLLGIGGMGAAAALGGAGTMAFLNDPESIKNNAVTAGNLDLKLDWFTVYNGPHGPEYNSHYPPTDDSDDNLSPMISLGDVKPGDYGCAIVSFHVSDNPAYIWFRPNNVSSNENGMNEPEEEAEGDLPGRGELEKHIQFVAAPLGCYKIHDDGSCDMSSEKMAKQMEDEPVHVDNYTTETSVANSSNRHFCLSQGTLDEFYNATKDGVRVPMWDHGHLSYTFEKSHLCLFGFCWYLPKEVGNVIQGDSFSFDLDFYAEQTRHNNHPESPWNGSD